jgi:hypothetical protein
MVFQADFYDDLIDLAKTVSESFSEEAEELLREDPQSLRRYVGSQAFLDDLLSYDPPLDLRTEVFFFVLLYQLRRKFRRDEDFRQEFRESFLSTSDRSWSPESVERFLDDGRLLHYLVDLLDTFVDSETVHTVPGMEDQEFRYVFEMIEASQTSGERQSYRIFRHIGDYSLYLTGVFPDWIRYRHERKNRPMDVDDYSDFGRTYFNKASKHRLAREKRMEPVFKKLSEGYDLVRTSLEMLFKKVVPVFQ